MASAPRDKIPRWIEGATVLVALVFANWPLLSDGGVSSDLVLFPDRLAAGEWWRFVLHPLVHVSRYHLLVDGVAFLLLLFELSGLGAIRRWFVVGMGASGSGIAALATVPAIAEIGLCGLSGAAHGMFAAAMLEWASGARSPRRKAMAVTSLLGLVGKCLYEMLASQPLLASLHMGSIGNPILVCHLGGALGGGVAWALQAGFRNSEPRVKTAPEFFRNSC